MSKINKQSSLRVFVGTSPDGMDEEACAVLEYSLRRHASVAVELEWLRVSADLADPCGGWITELWATPWTALRWAVPELCGWSGRAIYFDCPSLVLGDVAYLEQIVMPPGAFMLARREGRGLLTSCIVFDCAEAVRHLPAISVMKKNVGAHQDIGALLERRPHLVGALPGSWGWSDQAYAQARPSEVSDGSVHFEKPQVQPHIPLADARLRRAGGEHWFRGPRLPHYCSRLAALWEAEYVQAVKA